MVLLIGGFKNSQIDEAESRRRLPGVKERMGRQMLVKGCKFHCAVK